MGTSRPWTARSRLHRDNSSQVHPHFPASLRIVKISKCLHRPKPRIWNFRINSTDIVRLNRLANMTQRFDSLSDQFRPTSCHNFTSFVQGLPTSEEHSILTTRKNEGFILSGNAPSGYPLLFWALQLAQSTTNLLFAPPDPLLHYQKPTWRLALLEFTFPISHSSFNFVAKCSSHCL